MAECGRPQQYRRLARVLGIIRDIGDRPMLRRELAERYEVSERTITKDLELLRYGAGIRIGHDNRGYYMELPAPRGLR